MQEGIDFNVKNKRRKSVLFRYVIFGFCIVMTLFCLVIALWTVEKSQQLEKQMMDEENLLLVRTMEAIESNVSSLKRISDQIITDDEISPYRLRKGGYYTVEALKKLKYYCQGTDVFQDLLICLNNENEIYRTTGKEHFSTLTQIGFALEGTLTEDILTDLLSSKSRYAFLSATGRLINEKHQYNLITYPLYSADTTSYGTLVGMIETNFFFDALQESNLNSNTIICNGSGQVLFTNGVRNELSPQILEMINVVTEEPFFYELDDDGLRYQVVAYHSNATGWYYLRLVQQSDLIAVQKKEIQPFVGILLLASLIIASMMGMLIAFYYYLPVKSLLNLLNPAISYNAKRDEWLLINQYVKSLQKESLSMKQQTNLRNIQQIRDVLTEVLYGGGGISDAEKDLFEKYGFCDQPYKFFTILLIPQSELPEIESENLLTLLEENDYFFVTREIGGGFVCLFHETVGKQNVMMQCKALLEVLEEAGYHVHISVSEYVEDLGHLRDSLNECLLAAELDQDSTIVCLNSTFASNIQEFWQPCKEELLLELAIRNGDKTDIIKKSENLEHKLSSIMRYYLNNEMQYVFYRIMNYLVVRMHDVENKNSIEEQFQVMRDSKDVSNFFAAFRWCVEMLYGDLTAPVKEVKDKRIMEIKAFIDDNVCLPEMSLSYIADLYGIRDSYLSKLFKENLGENFIDYLLRKRLEEAARLLRETDLTVKQVVTSVGYSDATSFAKKFSKKYGVTPGIYKKTSTQNK